MFFLPINSMQRTVSLWWSFSLYLLATFSVNLQQLKDDITRNLDDVVCKLISLESGGAVSDSILSAQSQNYSTAESEVDSEGEEQQCSPQRKMTPHVTPVLPKPGQVSIVSHGFVLYFFIQIHKRSDWCLFSLTLK